MKKSFCFILNPLDAEPELRSELISGHVFRKAEPDQILAIKEKLALYLLPGHTPQYEFTYVPSEGSTTSNRSWNSKTLPPDQWRYWVIEFTGMNSETEHLALSLSLQESEIELGFEFLYPEGLTGYAFGLRTAQVVSFFLEINVNPIQPITRIAAEDLKQVQLVATQLALAKAANPSAYYAAHRFFHLNALPRRSEMLIIGYFSLIESLIAHKPRLAESLDSINHQLQAKLVLLSKRFDQEPTYTNQFNSLSGQKLWKRLYSYRSTIAHESLVSIDEHFSDLESTQKVVSFLKRTLKLLLRLALKEPELIADLKNC
jgi:Apea-like HEPN